MLFIPGKGEEAALSPYSYAVTTAGSSACLSGQILLPFQTPTLKGFVRPAGIKPGSFLLVGRACKSVELLKCESQYGCAGKCRKHLLILSEEGNSKKRNKYPASESFQQENEFNVVRVQTGNSLGKKNGCFHLSFCHLV